MPSVVLVLDDELDVANVIGTVLIEAGFVVRIATDPKEVLTGPLDDVGLVVFDYRMGEMDAPSFYALLEKRPDAPRTILCSGWEGSAVFAAEAGIPFVSKPFDIDDLVDKVRGALASRV